MDSIFDKITQAINKFLISLIEGGLSTMFNDVNQKVETIAAEVGKNVVSNSAGVIVGNTNINISSALTDIRTTLEAMGTSELFLLMLETALVSLCMKILSVCITVVIFGRMIET